VIVYWPAWKHAMKDYARTHGVKVPTDFRVTTRTCGVSCETLIKRIQRHAGLTPDGVLGPVTRQVLRGHVPAAQARAGVCWMARYGISIQPAFHYAQIRPIPHEIASGGPVTTDCSGSTTLFCELGGAPDPNGFHYNGLGNTSTLGAHLRHTTKAQLRPGDLVLFASPDHVGVVLEPGTDPLLESHGFEGGPLAIRLSVELRFHACVAAYLDLGV
jgi:hypothetical protein